MRCQIKFCVCFSSTAKQEKAHHPPMQRSFCIPHTFSALFSFALRVYSLLTDVNQGDQTWLTPLAFANHVTGEKKTNQKKKKNFADLNQKTSSWRTPDNKIQHSQITRSFPSKSKEKHFTDLIIVVVFRPTSSHSNPDTRLVSWKLWARGELPATRQHHEKWQENTAKHDSLYPGASSILLGS